MSATNLRIVLISLIASVLTSSVTFWMIEGRAKKTAVIDAVRLFDQFNMKKELEAKAKNVLLAKGKQLDSLTNLFNMAKATKNAEEEKKLGYACAYMKNALENEYKQSNKDISEQVWKRLNILLDAYGKKRGMNMIIGANGMGTVLYNGADYDMTNDAVTFINKKYEEGN